MLRIDTTVKEAQIYRQGAVLRREGTVTLGQGRSRVRIFGLEGSSDEETMRLYFPEKVTGTDIRVTSALTEGEERPSAAIEEKIQLLEQEMGILEQQIELWKDNGDLRSMQGTGLKDLEEYIEKLPERVTGIQRKINTLGREKAELEKELGKAYEEENRRVIEAELYTEEAGTYPFAVSFRDSAARWDPVYEIHAEGESGTVELRLRARVVQNTSAAWTDVKVRLFTGNPAASKTLPVLRKVSLSIKPEPVRNEASAPPASMAPKGMMGMMMAAASPQAAGGNAAEEAVNMMRVETPAAEEIGSETMTEYELTGTRDIPKGGEGLLFDLTKNSIPAKYLLFAVPKLDGSAYLCAEVRTEDLPAISGGRAAVYLDGVFIGNISLAPDMTKDTFRISLGTDENVQVRRKEVRKKDSAAAVRKIRSREYEYEISLSNKKPEAAEVLVTDQVPVSQDQMITVDLLEAGGGNADGESGEVTWKVTVPPQETRSLRLAYRVSWPKDREIRQTVEPSASPGSGFSGRIFCPDCGSPVTGRFCPVCGASVLR